MACVKGWADKIKIGHVNKFHYWFRLEHAVEFFNFCSFQIRFLKEMGQHFLSSLFLLCIIFLCKFMYFKSIDFVWENKYRLW